LYYAFGSDADGEPVFGWTIHDSGSTEHSLHYIARKARPWYPASWLDEAGNPLPGVHEVTPGEWPPCKPDELIEILTARQRSTRVEPAEMVIASTGKWAKAFSHYVAIRIVRRAGE
jgi:hypothetical protein